MSFRNLNRERTDLARGNLSSEAKVVLRRHLRRFPSDSDLYRKVLNKRAMSYKNLQKFASCTQLNKLASQDKHQNCKEFNYEEKLTSELNKFYSVQVRERRVCVKRKKSLAFSAVFKLLVNAQIINDRFTIGDVLFNGVRIGDMVEKESYRFEFAVPLHLGDNGGNFVIHRAEEDGFARLQLENCETWRDCLDPDGFLSANLVRSKLHLTMKSGLKILNSSVEQGVDKFPSGMETVEVYCEGSTIVLKINHGSVVVELIPTIPIPKSISEWCRRFPVKSEPPSHVVARPCQLPLSDPETLWELSFLSAEKKKLFSLGTTKYRLLLCLSEIRERDKTLGKLSLYHLQTVLYYIGEQVIDPLKWSKEMIGYRFLEVLRCLENFLERKFCPHYFLPKVNLFTCINEVTISLLKDRVRRMLKPSCVACGVATICKRKNSKIF